MIKVKTALISTYYKDGLNILGRILGDLEIEIISTGGTLEYLKNMGLEVKPVEDLTQFPEMLGGRVKTLHPKVFGGILNRRQIAEDQSEIAEFEIPSIDLVVVNLYPFQETLQKGGSLQEMIEKIDIGGVSLIRAAAKNFVDVCVVADKADYEIIAKELETTKGFISLETRKKLAAKAFQITASYDAAIGRYLSEISGATEDLPQNWIEANSIKNELRYGENPHQKAAFYGNLDDVFEKLHGKELSYNNLVDCESALNLLNEFEKELPTCLIVKHTNACGVATGITLPVAYQLALSCDPVSAFGGVIAVNQILDKETATLLNSLFFEILIAPEYDSEALEILKSRKNRIILKSRNLTSPKMQVKSLFNGFLVQQNDLAVVQKDLCTVTTTMVPTQMDWENLLFANKIVKHTKSNTIVLVKEGILLASGTGQTSRVDALKQAIQKSKSFGFDLKGAAMASDAFFPFSDCIEIAAAEGIKSVIQPGGSIKDQDSIDACNRLGICMVTTGIRHFKH
jgi:phosphoribosylaminoimidazolecarboxamide formyltransferase/IMP cyclohydrolase